MNVLCDAPPAPSAVAEHMPPPGVRLLLLSGAPNQEMGRATVLEALLPPLRAAAMLLAARRVDWSAASPARLADEADWMAARILVLGLSEVSVTLAQLPLLETANQRLQELGAGVGLQLGPATPALVAAQPATRIGALSRVIDSTDLLEAKLVARSQHVAAAVRRNLAPALRRALGV